jgi:hypothetical protein
MYTQVDGNHKRFALISSILFFAHALSFSNDSLPPNFIGASVAPGGLDFHTDDSIVMKEELPDSIKKLMESGDSQLKRYFKNREDYSGIRFKLRKNPYQGKVICLLNSQGVQYLKNFHVYGEYFLSFADDSTVNDRRLSGRIAFVEAGAYQPGIGVLLNVDEKVTVLQAGSFLRPLIDTISRKLESKFRQKGKYGPQKRSEIEEYLKVDAAFRINLRGESFYYVKWKRDKACFEICCSERHSVYDAFFREKIFSNSECDV